MQSCEDAHRLHRNDGARAIVGRPGTCDPTIEMAACHHDLILQLRICAGDLCDGVVTLLMVAGELCLHVKREAYRHVVLEQARNAAEGFVREDDGWDWLLVVGHVDALTHRLVVVVFHDAAIASIAGHQDGDGVLVREEFRDLLFEVHLLEDVGPEVGRGGKTCCS